MRPGAGARGIIAAFKDHFSGRPDLYARYRPRYPAALFEWLAGLCARRERAWDCATGNGQAAIAMAEHFPDVIATDASAAQIEAAIPHPRVSYRVAPAEGSGLDAGSIDLVTVGQALHWFDHDRFFAELRRVATARGVFAAWCYGLCEVSDECDAVVEALYSGVLDGFWPPERVLIERGYADIDLPGEELAAPAFDMRLDWQVDDMLGYLRTWSACKRYASRHGADPVASTEPALRAAWGGKRRVVRWPLTVRVCRL